MRVVTGLRVFPILTSLHPHILPSTQYSGPAIVLKSQLYDILHNRTTTDRQLDDMRYVEVV